jgi:type III secretory pathway component EscU
MVLIRENRRKGDVTRNEEIYRFSCSLFSLLALIETLFATFGNI